MNKYIFLFIMFFLLGTIITILSEEWSIQTNIQPLHTQFSFANAPTQSLMGKIASISGTVLWQSRIANQPEAITTPLYLQQGESVYTKDGTTTIAFPHIVSAVLNANSQINIIQTLPADIVLDQQQGSAIYTTQETKTPVSVRISSLLINLNTGVCTVSFDKDNALVMITANQGSATVAYNDMQNMTQIREIQQGNQLIYHTDTKTIDSM